jgi:hypothetical protein
MGRTRARKLTADRLKSPVLPSVVTGRDLRHLSVTAIAVPTPFLGGTCMCVRYNARSVLARMLMRLGPGGIALRS